MRKLLLEALEFESALNLHFNLCPIMTTSSTIFSISTGQAVPVENVSIDSILAEFPPPTKNVQCDFPALQEEMQDLHNVVWHQDRHPPIPGPRTTSENGDPINEQLLHDEQHDTEAVRFLLGLRILDNAITVKHYRWIVMSLRDKLLQAAPHEVPHGEAYARLLSRLVERLMPYPSQQESEYVLYLHRRNYVECLSKLLMDMAEGFVDMQQIGIEDDVYVKNKELHTDYLCYLVSRLRGA